MSRTKAKIIVIDDELGIRELLSYELSRIGYDVDTASNGEEGLAKIRQKKYDVVICDIKMPKLDGIKTLEGIKKTAPETEVIMATGFATVENAVQSMKDGAYDFVQKPFNLDELTILIEKALEKSELKTIIALYESSKAIFACHKLEELFPIMINLVKKVIRVDEIALLLCDHQNQLYIAAASFPLVYYPYKGTFITLAEKLLASGDTQGASIIEGASAADNPKFAGIMQNSQMKSIVAYPLVLKNTTLGMLMITRSKDHSDFSPTDIRNLSIFVSQITQAIANTKLYEKLDVRNSEYEGSKKRLEQIHRHIAFLEEVSASKNVAASIAHLFSDSVQNLSNATEHVLASGSAAPAMQTYLSMVKNTTAHCSEILSTLSRYASVNKDSVEDTNINTLLKDTIELMDFECNRSHVTIDQQLESSLPEMRIDPHQAKLAFLHLLVNALESFDACNDRIDDEKTITVKTSHTVNEIVIEIADNGCGIDPKIQDSIFNRFFTTKPPHKHLGLGLLMTDAIAKQYGGGISVKSVPREGTTARLTFPFA